MLYNISFGWNMSELSLGIKGDAKARVGSMVRPVETLNAERWANWERLYMDIRCDRQYAGLRADVLRRIQ